MMFCKTICRTLFFVMVINLTRKELVDFFNTFENSTVDCPFSGDNISLVARHISNGKWYALVMKLDGKDIVNLKCDPLQSQFLRDNFDGIYEAYHMNKVHWNTVDLESDVPSNLIKDLVSHSFELSL